MQRQLNAILHVGSDPDDDPVVALRKQILVSFSGLISVAGAGWGLVYFAYGEPLAGSIPFGYAVLSTLSLIVFGVTKEFGWLRKTQLAQILVLPFLLQLALGGFVSSSAVIVWALMAPIGGMLVSSRRVGTVLFVALLVELAVAQVLQGSLDTASSLPDWLRGLFFAFNVGGVSTTAFLTVSYFVSEKDRAMDLLGLEREKSERLLLNVLPREIAAQLKDGPETIARQYDSASVLFADIVDFTRLTTRLGASELVARLNDVFRFFDDLVDEHGCEKIRTIGDNYMIASGVPTPRADHAAVLADLALAMLRYTERTDDIQFRIGMNSGPLVAGVIGRSKFQYDLWGDTVNLASRMESHGEPGRVQITAATRALIADEFECSRRGSVTLKGGAEAETWFLEARKPSR